MSKPKFEVRCSEIMDDGKVNIILIVKNISSIIVTDGYIESLKLDTLRETEPLEIWCSRDLCPFSLAYSEKVVINVSDRLIRRNVGDKCYKLFFKVTDEDNNTFHYLAEKNVEDLYDKKYTRGLWTVMDIS